MTRPRNKLSAREVATAKPGKHCDGGGLWLQCRDAQHKSWIFRYQRHGVKRAMGLGVVEDVPLADARRKAEEARRLLLEGLDPLTVKAARKADAKAEAQAKSELTGRTFRKITDMYLAAHEASWRNPKHRAQWRATLDTYAMPVLGAKAISAITTAHVMDVVEPLWQRVPETASRVRGRIEAVLDYATARSWRSGDNPARWRGHLDNLLPARAKIAKVKHHAALPWREVGQFMEALRRQEGVSAAALAFCILTAARTGEVLGARWGEINLAERLWTVPAERMKAGREHRVPLSDAATAVLRGMCDEGARAMNGYVFPGPRNGAPLSTMALLMLLRRMDRTDLTTHGFRSTFRDWCAEATNFPREIAEEALAHTLKDKVEAAYQRGDALNKRRRVMEAWGSYCSKPTPAASSGKVVSIASAV